MENPDKHNLGQRIEVKTDNDKSLIACTFDEMALYFNLPKTYNPCLIMRKTSEKLKLKDILQNARRVLLANCPGTRKQGVSKELSQLRDMTAQHSVGSWMGFQDRKERLGKNQGI